MIPPAALISSIAIWKLCAGSISNGEMIPVFAATMAMLTGPEAPPSAAAEAGAAEASSEVVLLPELQAASRSAALATTPTNAVFFIRSPLGWAITQSNYNPAQKLNRGLPISDRTLSHKIAKLPGRFREEFPGSPVDDYAELADQIEVTELTSAVARCDCFRILCQPRNAILRD